MEFIQKMISYAIIPHLYKLFYLLNTYIIGKSANLLITNKL